MGLQRCLHTSSVLILVVQLLSCSSSSSNSSSSCIRSINPETTAAQQGKAGGSNESWISYDCHVRTLNSLELGNSSRSFILESDIPRARSIRIHCNDKLFFQSFLFSNQTFFPSLSLVSLARLDIDSCKIRRLEGGSIFWNGLPFLRTLSIQSRNSQWSSSVTLELFPNSFQGLTQLQTLDLTFNNIWTLPENLLCPLRSLTNLNISQNKLAEIDELNSNVKSGTKACILPALETVDISGNSLRQIGVVTQGWASLKTLLLGNNFIDQIQDEAFTNLEGLIKLNLNSNRLVALPPFLFRANGRLRELYVANNSISALSPSVFSNVGELRVLDLSRNLLSSQWVKGGVFGGLKGLRVLRLSWNGLSTLSEGVFAGLGALQVLSVDNNQIEAIAPGVFKGLGGLRALDLSNNRLSALDGRGLEGLGALKQLYLDHNVLQGLGEGSLRNCSELTDLGLAGNHLQEVPLALRGLTLLRSLDLGENRIATVTNASFEGLDELYGLRMVDNRLTELPPSFCAHLKKLRVLNLAQNRLARIASSALISCTELRALRLDSNALQNFPPLNTPTNPSSLLWLNMSTNRIESAEYHLLPPTLEWLDLSHNLLQDFAPPRGTPPPHLRVLDISFNKLQELNFETLPPKLETIRANHNQLEKIQIRPSLLSSIRRVELVSNKLTSLPTLTALAVSGRGTNMRMRKPDFFLGGNPFKCDCTLEWLHSSPHNVVRTVDLDAISCTPTYPLNSATPIPLSSVEDFLCPFNSHCDPSCSCCDFDACDCAMICPENCGCFHDQTWSRTIVNCAGRNQTGIPPRIPMNATEVFLDGNTLPTLARHIFIGRRSLRVLNLNSSRVELISNKTFNGLKSLEILQLSENLLTALHGYEFADLENLRELYLQNNFLGFIAPHTFHPLKLLRTLRLDGNLLVSLNFQSLLNSQKLLSRFLFSQNPWTCECDFISRLRSWVAPRAPNLITDFNTAQCKLHSAQSASGQNPLIASKCFANQEPSSNQIPPPFSNFPPNLFLPFPAAAHPPPPNNRHANQNTNPFSIGQPFSAGAPISARSSHSENTNHAPYNNSPSSAKGYPTNQSPSAALAPNNQLAPLLSAGAGGANNYLPSPLDGIQHQFDSANPGLLWTIVLTSVGFLMLVLVVIVIFRREIYYRLNDRLNLCFCCGELCSGVRQIGKKWWLRGTSGVDEEGCERGARTYAEDSEKLFDAYFLYSKKDEELVLEKMVPELERVVRERENFRLCLHYRDLCLSPGNPWNSEMVLSAAEASKRLVLVLSRSFLNNEYTCGDLQNLLHGVLGAFAKKTIVVLLPCLSPENWESTGLGAIFNQQSAPLRRANRGTLLRSGVVCWNEPEFWPRFKILLPPPNSSSGRICTVAQRSLPRNYVTTGNFNLLQPPAVSVNSQSQNRIKHSALVLSPPPPVPLHLDLPPIPLRQKQPLPNLPICSHSCINSAPTRTREEHFYTTLSMSRNIQGRDKGVKCPDKSRHLHNDHSNLRDSNSLNLQCYRSEERGVRHQFHVTPDLVNEANHVRSEKRNLEEDNNPEQGFSPRNNGAPSAGDNGQAEPSPGPMVFV